MGTHAAEVALMGTDSPRAKIKVIGMCRANAGLPLIPCTTGGVAHIILEVRNDGSPQLRSYRRVILKVVTRPQQKM